MATWRYEISLLVLKKYLNFVSPLGHVISSISFLSSRRPLPGCSNVHYPRAKKNLVFKPVLFASSSHIYACRGRSLLIFNYLLEDDLLVPLPTGQVSFISYLPSKKIQLYWTARHNFFQPLLGVFISHQRSENSLFTTQNSPTNVQ